MTSNEFSSFLNGISTNSLPVLDALIPLQHYIPLDLSVHNAALQTVDVSDATALEHYIHSHIELNNGLVAYGGYNETRNIYRRSTYFNQEDVASERNIHLGMDLWLEAGSQIFSPLDAIVHSFNNNTNHGDYGPTIILKHQIEEVEFFTLHGHLSLDSIEDIQIGQAFKQREKIATLGDASVNGDYPPHLHFQIIKDIQNYEGDYPGVCNIRDLQFYLGNCPDPNLLLKIG